jgi:SNF2 family DNA or RNA helicase
MPKDYALNPQQLEAYEQLKKIRASTTVALKPSVFLRSEVVGLDGEKQAFKLRYYQVQGTFHLMRLKRMVLGDDTGLGKTVETVAALCYLWEREPENKIIVVAPKSAIRQWASEIKRFAKNIRPIIAETPKSAKAGGGLAARKAAYKEWLDAPTGPNDPKVVLILNYSLLVRDWNIEGFQPLKPNGKPDPKQPVLPGVLDGTTQRAGKHLVVIFDECTAFKNMSTKTWEVARYLSDRADRVYGLTATLLKNRLIEGYCIYKAIKPDLFTTKTQFYEDYCHIEMQSVAGKRKIPIIKGYRNLEHFRARIDPFFLGRKKHMVSDELPSLTTREIVCSMQSAEEVKYKEALSGVLELGDGELREFEENKALVSLIYCQQVVDSLHLLKFKEGDIFSTDEDIHKLGTLGSKEQELVDLVTGELDDDKIIVYTRFESLVGRLQAILKREGVQSVRITGKESDAVRQVNQGKFQDLNSKVKVIFITSAGSEAINLQAAKALVFYDLPWSWGDYVQVLGRMIRIGSPHQKVLAYHLMAEQTGSTRDDEKTIDHHVLGMLRRKKNLIDKVLGEGAVGALTIERGGSIRDLVRSMQGHSSV